MELEEPREEGRLLRLASVLSPGVRHIREQIPAFQHEWDRRNDAVLRHDSASRFLWVALGDSLSQAVGASSVESSWLMRIADQRSHAGYPVEIVNLSVAGACVADVLGQLERLDQLDMQPGLLTCTVGSNDLLRPSSLGTVRRDLAQLTEALGCGPTPSIIATIPDRKSLAARALNRRLRALAQNSGIGIAEVAPLATLARGERAPDQFHPNDVGYPAWELAFSEAIEQIVRRSDSVSHHLNR